ncbi:hypothetical protein Pcinc_027472 [Petrolisthes cinctipes]|uniref:PH domain-containing protein n=1 Tax=Petrolisthes cinctipes TaxID=88211 RepID=A0AAE1F4B6_PETCI|nr:hypothetical protein Pcinc_027472 [Petrolisthes cinctipes]
MAGKNEEVLKEAFMTKRSQNKRSFTPTNWKERWFVLSPENLIYYDGDKQQLFPVGLTTRPCTLALSATLGGRECWLPWLAGSLGRAGASVLSPRPSAPRFSPLLPSRPPVLAREKVR